MPNNRRGMTLIEVAIAMSILLVVFLALMQTALVSIDANTVNVLREEGIAVAEENMISHVMNTPFDQLHNEAALVNINNTVSRTVRGIQKHEFTRSMAVANLTDDNCLVTVEVEWKWKEDDYSQSLTTVRTRE